MRRLADRARRLASDAQRRGAQRGQVIVIFALSLVALLLVAGLVLDVARVYTVLRYQRSVADAAALAGAQDLQVPGTRNVSPNDYIYAREHALELLNRELGGTSADITSVAGCDPGVSALPGGTNASTSSSGVNITGCPIVGTPYVVAITTPYSGAMTVSTARAVKVTITQPSFPLTFGNLICLLPGSQCTSGAPVWGPSVASVAGMGFVAQYALMTLQPPNIKPHAQTDANLNKDLIVYGNNTLLNILEGDVGTNTSATTNNSGSGSNPAYIRLASGYLIDHYDDLTGVGTTWLQVNGLPEGHKIGSLINDPGYTYPVFTGAPQYATQAAGVDTSSCLVPGDWKAALPNVTSWTCYKPGVYNDPQGFNVAQNASGAYLESGAYSFPYGVKIGGTLAGGLVSNAPGVVLQLPESGSTATFNMNNAVNVLLNAGSYCSSSPCSNKPATPAIDFAGNAVVTPQGLVLTIMVQKDSACFVGGGAVPQLCATNNDATVNLAGNGMLNIAGVIYGPSDNMTINANQTVQTGVVGQIVSYTAYYKGGAQLIQQYPVTQGAGELRLDTACSPGEPCP